MGGGQDGDAAAGRRVVDGLKKGKICLVHFVGRESFSAVQALTFYDRV